MVRPAKRPRLSFTQDSENVSDALDLQAARAQNDLRLKSIFEGIFEKYGKDFGDVGDEIDLQTGQIVVNHGHIMALDGEEGMNDKTSWLFDAGLSAPSEHQTQDVASSNSDYHDSEIERAGDLPEGNKTQATISALDTHPAPAATSSADAEPVEKVNGTEDDSDDDRSSVDSLLDVALVVTNDQENIPGQDRPSPETGKPLAVAARVNSSIAPSTHFRNLQQNTTDAVDPLWQVPDIGPKFSTPTLHEILPRPVSHVRAPSPPGSGSIWALSRSRKRNTGLVKKTKKKVDIPKQTCHSSPAVRDWSFAETPDGSESDDPLQEDYQPSPTPKLPTRGIKASCMGKPVSPMISLSLKKTCRFCKGTFSHADFISHLNSVIKSGGADGQHDVTEVNQWLDASDGPTVATQPRIERSAGGKSIYPPKSPAPGSDDGSPGLANDSTPTGKKRLRTLITPDQARLIVKMRHVQKKQWKEVLKCLPGKKLPHLVQWNRLHWNERRANPPPLSKSWSQEEQTKLDRLKDEKDISWSAIHAELAGRTHAEIEFELLRLWAGDDVWKRCERQQSTASSEQDDTAGQEDATASAQEQELSGKQGSSSVAGDQAKAPMTPGDDIAGHDKTASDPCQQQEIVDKGDSPFVPDSQVTDPTTPGEELIGSFDAPVQIVNTKRLG